MFYRRVAGFFDELRTKDFRRVAVFAHGGVLLCAGLYVGMFGEKEAWNNLVGFGGIQRIDLVGTLKGQCTRSVTTQHPHGMSSCLTVARQQV